MMMLSLPSPLLVEWEGMRGGRVRRRHHCGFGDAEFDIERALREREVWGERRV